MADEMSGKRCQLVHNIRDASGKVRSKEDIHIIVRSLNNLGRAMYLIRHPDDSTTFVFPDEVIVLD